MYSFYGRCLKCPETEYAASNHTDNRTDYSEVPDNDVHNASCTKHPSFDGMVIDEGYFVEIAEEPAIYNLRHPKNIFRNPQKIVPCRWGNVTICRPWNCTLEKISGALQNNSIVTCQPVEDEICAEGYQDRLCARCACDEGML